MQGTQQPDDLAVDGQWFAAGCQNVQVGTDAQETAQELGASAHQVFAIVEHQQHVSVAQVLGQGVRRVAWMDRWHTHGGRDRAGDERWFGKLGQFDQPGAVGEGGGVLAGQLSAETRLADATRAHDGHQRRRLQNRPQLAHLLFATDEAVERARQVVARIVAEPCRRGWTENQARTGRASTDDHRLELGELCPVQAECLDELRHRVTARRRAFAALQSADAARTHTRAFGKLLLGKSGSAPVIAQDFAELDWARLRRLKSWVDIEKSCRHRQHL